MRKKSEEGEQTLAELSSAHRCSRATCQLVQTSHIKRVCHIINILLTELSRSVWENLDLGRVYRPHCVRSVLTTSVKILPYRPPARLIRAKYCAICIAAAQDWDSEFPLDEYCKKELVFWKSYAKQSNSRAINDKQDKESNFIVYSDASASGCGAHLDLNGE